MSEDHNDSPDLFELKSSGSFNQDLAAELAWMQERKRRIDVDEAIYQENRQRSEEEDKRLAEIRMRRVDRELGEHYSKMPPAEQYVRARAVRAAAIAHHDQVRDRQKAVDSNSISNGYDSFEISLLDNQVGTAAEKWYEQDKPAYMEEIQATIARRMPALPDTSVSASDYKMKLLKKFDYDQQKLFTALYKQEGLDNALMIYAQSVQENYDACLAARHKQEEKVLDDDKSSQWGIGNLELAPIEEDVEFASVAARNQKPTEIGDIDNILLREEFKRYVDPNNYQIIEEDPVLLERDKAELLRQWREQYTAELRPIIERRYDNLQNLYAGSDNMYASYQQEWGSGEHMLLGRTILPVAAIIDPHYGGDWRLIGGKTGAGSGHHSPTTIIDIATRLAMGEYSELNKYGDEGRIFAHRSRLGGVAYEAAAGPHRVAAHKLIGKRTMIMNCTAPDRALAEELRSAVL